MPYLTHEDSASMPFLRFGQIFYAMAV